MMWIAKWAVFFFWVVKKVHFINYKKKSIFVRNKRSKKRRVKEISWKRYSLKKNAKFSTLVISCFICLCCHYVVVTLCQTGWLRILHFFKNQLFSTNFPNWWFFTVSNFFIFYLNWWFPVMYDLGKKMDSRFYKNEFLLKKCR